MWHRSSCLVDAAPAACCAAASSGSEPFVVDGSTAVDEPDSDGDGAADESDGMPCVCELVEGTVDSAPVFVEDVPLPHAARTHVLTVSAVKIAPRRADTPRRADP